MIFDLYKPSDLFFRPIKSKNNSLQSHFDSRHQKPRHGRGKKGKVISIGNDTSIQENFSLTALMRIDQPIFSEIRYDSNDQWDFYQFMINAYSLGHINSNDHIIFDNASVHSSTSIGRFFLHIMYSSCANTNIQS